MSWQPAGQVACDAHLMCLLPEVVPSKVKVTTAEPKSASGTLFLGERWMKSSRPLRLKRKLQLKLKTLDQTQTFPPLCHEKKLKKESQNDELDQAAEEKRSN